ncbi:MAG: hypothetical protein JWQ96_3427, partial [Segetibacter sp.]|nr:hypothetical protein [Segetibacter sp.]
MKYRLTIIATFLTCLVLISARRSFDIPVWMGRWTEKQNETSATEWIFQGRDNFAKIGYGGADEIGGKVQKGTYVIDTVNKVVRLNFTKEIDIKN